MRPDHSRAHGHEQHLERGAPTRPTMGAGAEETTTVRPRELIVLAAALAAAAVTFRFADVDTGGRYGWPVRLPVIDVFYWCGSWLLGAAALVSTMAALTACTGPRREDPVGRSAVRRVATGALAGCALVATSLAALFVGVAHAGPAAATVQTKAAIAGPAGTAAVVDDDNGP